MTDYKQLCGELLNRLNGLYEEVIDAGVGCVPDEAQDLMNRAWDAMAEPEPERLTVQQINDLPRHRENFIYSDSNWPGEIKLDGTFSRADLQQLADSIPASSQKD